MKNVILTPNPYRDKGFQTVREAKRIFEEAGVSCKICLPFEVDSTFVLPSDLHFHRLDREIHHCDLVICFGGDGTILHMAKTATKAGIPILGVNIGTMGFIAELESTELDQLKRLANDDYSIDSRLMLDVIVQRNQDIIFHDISLNDIVVTKGAVARIMNLSVECDGVEAISFGGDGVIVSTPTGSTAYSLSAGGPIIEPETDSMLITPICAHDIVSRCIVTSGKRVITINMRNNTKRNAFLSVDGGKAIKLNPEDKVIIRKSKLETKLLRLKDRSFYDVVNMKFRG